MGKQAFNPYLPSWEYVPDAEPHIVNGRVYVYGSHDLFDGINFCLGDYVCWSAPVDDLRHWRYDGVIFEVSQDARGNLLNPDGRGDILFAPDVVEKVAPDGKRTYYLYPNNQGWRRIGMVAKADRPDGPFTVCNWDPKDPSRSDGALGFDPGVLIEPADVVLLEGIHVFYDPQVRDLLDFKVYIQVDPDVCLLRRVKRDIRDRGRTVESIYRQYLETVKPMYEKQGCSRETQALDMENCCITVPAFVPWSIICSVPLQLLGTDYRSMLYASFLYLVPLIHWLRLALSRKTV